MLESDHEKPLFWLGRSYDDLVACPAEVRQTFGFALGLAQQGGKFIDAKPLKGFGGAGVLEIIENSQSETFRCVLHRQVCPSGLCTPHLSEKVPDWEQDAEAGNRPGKGTAETSGSTLHPMDRKTEIRNVMKTKEVIRQGAKNIFEDLKLPNAEELNAKAQIAYRICAILAERKLTQQAAADLLNTDQPRISSLLRGRLEGFSSDRLFRFLNALDQDIEIVIRRTKKLSQPEIRVLAIA